VVVTHSFLAGGKDGYLTFLRLNDSYVNTYVEYAQSFINYAQQVKIIAEPPLSEYSTQSITFITTVKSDSANLIPLNLLSRFFFLSVSCSLGLGMIY